MEEETLLHYILKEVLSNEGEGYHNSIVRKAFCTKTQKIVVIKYFKEMLHSEYDRISLELIEREGSSLQFLEHPGIVKCHGYGKDVITVNGKPVHSIFYIVTEYLCGGSLFDILGKISLPEGTICFMFEELLKITEYIHSKGFAHLDIKLENIMIDNEGRMKFIDFGFAQCLKGERGNGKMKAWVGTRTYKAPEINEQIPFSGFAVDIFALGVILFSLIGKLFPFGTASQQDAHYILIYNGFYDKYWKVIEKNVGSTKFSIDLQNFLSGIFSYSAASRMTIAEILSHPWIRTSAKPTEVEAHAQLLALCKLPKQLSSNIHDI